MDPLRIITKAEAYKIKSHRLSFSLRLNSVPEAKKFLMEHGAVLWKTKAELPNLLDAIIGRVANGKERIHGKPAEQCMDWKRQICDEEDFVECNFFRNQPTVVVPELLPYLSVFARINRERAEEKPILSKDAKRIMHFLAKEGPSDLSVVKRALKFTSEKGRPFLKARKELERFLIVLPCRPAPSNEQNLVLGLWENSIPRTIRSRSEQISKKEAALKLLAKTCASSVIANEKNVPEWFRWSGENLQDIIQTLVSKKEVLRIEHQKNRWLIAPAVIKAKK